MLFYTLLRGTIGEKAHGAGPALIEMLNGLKKEGHYDENFQRREQVVKALCKIGEHPSLVPLLKTTLDNPSASIKMCAVEILASWGKKDLVLPVLLAKDAVISYTFLECAEKIGPEARELIPTLSEHSLMESDEYKRSAIAEALWAMGEREVSLDTLLSCDKIEKISKLGKEAAPAIPRLIRRLQTIELVKMRNYSFTNYPFTRKLAAAIGELGKYAPASSTQLFEIYPKQDGWRKLCIAEALLIMGEETAVDWMLKAMKDPENQKDLKEGYKKKDRRSFVREAFDDYITAAVENGKGIDTLVQGLKEPIEHVRGYAHDVLRNMGEEAHPAVSSLIELIKNEKTQRETKLLAIEILSRVGKKAQAAQTVLLEALQDKDAEVRSYAVFALGRIAKAETQDSLNKMLKDDDRWVRSYAEYVLEKPKTKK